MFDFIIVGAGLAGVSFANLLEKHQKTFCILSDRSQVASLIAGGVYNPVVLKRFTPIWKADEVTALCEPFYCEIEEKTGVSFHKQLPVYRKFASIEEQNNWFTASDSPVLSRYLSTRLELALSDWLPAPFGLGEVKHTGRVDVKRYLEASLGRWQREGFFHAKTFDYSALEIGGDCVSYKGVTARHIVFCEGCGISKNPYFKTLPMRPCKGETLTFYAPDLQLKSILKSDGVIMPMGDDYYTIGATYDPEDLSEVITEKAREELLGKLNKMTCCSYEVVSHQAAIRPTVADRRPLVGAHPLYPRLWVLNGLGTRGVLNAPYCGEVLYKAVFEGEAIPKEMDVARFKKRMVNGCEPHGRLWEEWE